MKILIVDDKQENLYLLEALLRGNGYEIDSATNGVDALAKVLQDEFDMIISDILMPDMDGFQLCRAVKTHWRLKHIAFVFYTATYTDPQDEKFALSLGAEKFIVKPQEPQVFIEMLREVIKNRKAGTLTAPPPIVREEVFLKEYNERLVQKLEDKMLELERDIAERKRVEESLQQQLTRINLLNQITRAIAERQDVESIFQTTLRRLEDYLPIDFGCICLFDAPADALTIFACGSQSESLAATLSIPQKTVIPVADTAFRKCLEGEIVYVPDQTQVDAVLSRKFAGAGLRSAVGVSLMVEDKTLGVMVVSRRDVDGFSSVDGQFLRVLSEHVALAARQAQLREDLQKAYDDLRATQQAMMQQERLRALGQMASGIAHDINNALAPIVGYTELLLTDEEMSDQARQCLELVKTAGVDISRIVARMQEFYRQRREQEVMWPVSLNRIVRQTIDLTRPRWKDIPQQQGVVIEVSTDLQDDVPDVIGLDSEIREALTNLILNAVDAMPNGGTVTIGTYGSVGEKTPAQVVLEVTDTGTGMDEETQRSCLEPFFSTKGEHGTGLGLSVVLGIMRRHEGRIDVESALGKGTAMRLIFPVRQLEQVHGFEARPTIAVTPLRVLCIDDELSLRNLLKDMLENDKHTVKVAESGQAGLDALRAAQQQGEPFDVVITDLGMPHMDGRAVARAVKRESPQTPVILLTGWGTRFDAEGDVPPEVDATLSKPPQVNMLRQTLAQVKAVDL